MDELPDHPFLTADAPVFGLSRRRLRGLVEAGTLRRVLHGVYCKAELPDSIDLRAACAALVLPEHAVVADRSAAWLHGIDCLDPTARDIPPRLEVVSVGGADRTRRQQALGGKRTVAASDICRLGGVAVTTPLRTVSDLACLRGRYFALAALDSFMHEFGITHAQLESMVARYAGRRGVTQFRELSPLACPLAESPGESWTRMAIIDGGLPVPRSQHKLWLEGFGLVRLDLAYPALKIAVEYDGEEFHSNPDDREADAKRRRALRELGWIVIVVRKHDFAGPALDDWLGELRSALSERTPPPRRRYARNPLAAPRRRRQNR